MKYNCKGIKIERLIEIIRKESDCVESTTGKKPTCIYLGYKEFEKLKAETEVARQYAYGVQHMYPVFDGKRICFVAKDSYFFIE